MVALASTTGRPKYESVASLQLQVFLCCQLPLLVLLEEAHGKSMARSASVDHTPSL